MPALSGIRCANRTGGGLSFQVSRVIATCYIPNWWGGIRRYSVRGGGPRALACFPGVTHQRGLRLSQNILCAAVVFVFVIGVPNCLSAN